MIKRIFITSILFSANVLIYASQPSESQKTDEAISLTIFRDAHRATQAPNLRATLNQRAVLPIEINEIIVSYSALTQTQENDIVLISAKTGKNVDLLCQKIIENIPSPLERKNKT